MNPYSELFLRCSTLASAADIKGPLSQDILCKCIINAGLGFVMSTRTDEGHFVKFYGPITLRTHTLSWQSLLQLAPQPVPDDLEFFTW